MDEKRAIAEFTYAVYWQQVRFAGAESPRLTEDQAERLVETGDDICATGEPDTQVIVSLAFRLRSDERLADLRDAATQGADSG